MPSDHAAEGDPQSGPEADGIDQVLLDQRKLRLEGDEDIVKDCINRQGNAEAATPNEPPIGVDLTEYGRKGMSNYKPAEN